MEKVKEYNNIVGFRHIQQLREQDRLNQRSLRSIFAQVQDQVDQLKNQCRMIGQLSQVLRARSILDPEQLQQCQRDIRVYQTHVLNSLNMLYSSTDFIVNSENIIDNEIKQYLENRINEYLQRQIDLVYEQAPEEGEHRKRYFQVGRESAFVECLDLRRVRDWVHLVGALSQLYERLSFRLLDAHPVFLQIRKLLADCRALLQLRQDIAAGGLGHCVARFEKPLLRQEEYAQRSRVQQLVELGSRLHQFLSTYLKEQKYRGMLKTQFLTNTMKRYTGDKGKITNFHFTINHKNLKPLLTNLSPQRFQEKSTSLTAATSRSVARRKATSSTYTEEHAPSQLDTTTNDGDSLARTATHFYAPLAS